MSNHIVPADVRLAAKRGFVRTTAQAYAATIPAGGVSAAVLSNVIESPDALQLGIAVAAWVVSPVLAGVASYLSITARGIPEEYQAAA